MDVPSKAPAALKIDMAATLTGVRVRISFGPSASDPMGHNGRDRFYPDLEEAVESLSNEIYLYLDELTKKVP